MKAYKNIVFVLVIGVAILAQLTNPTLARADGEPPTSPPEATPTDLPVATEPPLLPTEPATEVAPTELPVATEPPTLPAEPATEAAPTELPVATEPPTLTAEPATEAAPTELPVATEVPSSSEIIPVGDSPTVVPVEPIAAEEPTLLEVIQEIPAETDIAVLDENGVLMPLATQAAANIIVESDPVWCPTGQNPTPGANGCTASYTTLGDLLADAVAVAYINAQIVNGTIWISSGAINEAGAISIDGLTYTNWASQALTLQGGWCDGSDPTCVGLFDTNKPSSFSVPISIINWNNDVAVNNITINGNGTVTGLTVTTTGNVDIKDSQFNQNFIGASISSNGNVRVDGSVFHNDVYDGLRIFTSNSSINNIELNNSKFSYNNRNYTDGYGVWLITNPDDIVNAVGNTFINNWYGLVAYTANINNNILLTNTFNFNCYDVFTYSISQNGNYCGPPLPPPEPNPAPEPPIATINSGASGELFTLNCAGVDGFIVNLPNGDLVNIYCPVKGEASINRVDNTTLPADLPTGYIYASAFRLEILQDEKPIPVIAEGGYITASFVAQPLQPGNTYSILYWDNGTWIPLKDFMLDENNQAQTFDLTPGVPGDTRKIIRGVNLVTKRGSSRVEISTNFPGIFVLVQQ